MDIHISFRFNSSPFNYKSDDIEWILFNKENLKKFFQKELLKNSFEKELSKTKFKSIFFLERVDIETYGEGYHATDNIIFHFRRTDISDIDFNFSISHIQKNIISKILKAQERVTRFRISSYSDRCFFEKLFAKGPSNSLERTLERRKKYRNHLIDVLNFLSAKTSEVEIFKERINRLEQEISKEIKENNKFWNEFYSD